MIDRYRMQVLPTKRSAQTRVDEGKALDRLKRVYGHMLPEAVSAPMLYQYLDRRQTKDGKPALVAARHEIMLLGHVYGKAMRWGVARSNPVRGLDFGGRAGKRRQVSLIEVDQVRALASPRMQIAIDLAVITGQRRGDLLALTRSQLTDEGIVFRQSKTGAGVLITWSHDLRAIVDRAKALAPQIPAEYLIRKANGRPYSARGFSAIWQRLMTKHANAGGQRFTFHDLRSVSADGAESPEEARDRLGHANVETKRHYLRGLTKAKPRS
jgi:integrase